MTCPKAQMSSKMSLDGETLHLMQDQGDFMTHNTMIEDLSMYDAYGRFELTYLQ